MKVSVIIATVNRCAELRETLLAYRRQSHSALEIVVIDNGSRDGSRKMVEGEFPDVVYRWLPYNMGTHAINLGFELATGDIFWLSNNDSYPACEHALAQIVEIFTRFPDIHIIGSEDIEANDGNRVFNWHPIPVDKEHVPPEGYPTNLFHGTGAALRRAVIADIGGFWDEFVFEELDFCTRAIAGGYNCRYFPNIRTLHFASPRQRVQTERWVAAALNLMRYHWRHFPFFPALWRSAYYYPYFLLQGLMYPARPSQFFEVMFGSLAVVFRTWRRERKPIPAELLPAVTLGLNPLLQSWRHAATLLKHALKRRRGRA